MDLEDLFDRGHHRRKSGYRDHENKHGHYGERHGENRHAPFDRDHHDDNEQWRKNGSDTTITTMIYSISRTSCLVCLPTRSF
jgi:hypothetical protein